MEHVESMVEYECRSAAMACSECDGSGWIANGFNCVPYGSTTADEPIAEPCDALPEGVCHGCGVTDVPLDDCQRCHSCGDQDALDDAERGREVGR